MTERFFGNDRCHPPLNQQTQSIAELFVKRNNDYGIVKFYFSWTKHAPKCHEQLHEIETSNLPMLLCDADFSRDFSCCFDGLGGEDSLISTTYVLLHSGHLTSAIGKSEKENCIRTIESTECGFTHQYFVQDFLVKIGWNNLRTGKRFDSSPTTDDSIKCCEGNFPDSEIERNVERLPENYRETPPSTNLSLAFFQMICSFLFITFHRIETQAQHIYFDPFTTLQHCHIPSRHGACRKSVFLANTLVRHNQQQIIFVWSVTNQIDGFIVFGIGHWVRFVR